MADRADKMRQRSREGAQNLDEGKHGQRPVAELGHGQVREEQLREVAPEHDADLAQEEQVRSAAQR